MGVLKKKCPENMQQIYRRKPMPNCDFSEVVSYGCFPVTLLHIFRKAFLKNTSGWLLLSVKDSFEASSRHRENIHHNYLSKVMHLLLFVFLLIFL